MKAFSSVVMALSALLATGCCGKETSKSEPTTVTPGSGGNWRGDPKACAALKACCTGPGDVTLFCALAEQAADVKSDCTKGLPKIRTYLTESKKKPPAGCM